MALRTRFSRAIMVSAWLITASACASGMQITPSVSASSRSPGLTVTAPMPTRTCTPSPHHYPTPPPPPPPPPGGGGAADQNKPPGGEAPRAAAGPAVGNHAQHALAAERFGRK